MIHSPVMVQFDLLAGAGAKAAQHLDLPDDVARAPGQPVHRLPMGAVGLIQRPPDPFHGFHKSRDLVVKLPCPARDLHRVAFAPFDRPDMFDRAQRQHQGGRRRQPHTAFQRKARQFRISTQRFRKCPFNRDEHQDVIH